MSQDRLPRMQGYTDGPGNSQSPREAPTPENHAYNGEPSRTAMPPMYRTQLNNPYNMEPRSTTYTPVPGQYSSMIANPYNFIPGPTADRPYMHFQQQQQQYNPPSNGLPKISDILYPPNGGAYHGSVTADQRPSTYASPSQEYCSLPPKWQEAPQATSMLPPSLLVNTMQNNSENNAEFNTALDQRKAQNVPGAPIGPPMGTFGRIHPEISQNIPQPAPPPVKAPKPNFVPGELPYDPAALNWNADSTLNEENKYCYCGEDRNLLDVDVQCTKCLNFFHGRCIRLGLGPVVPFMTNYHFMCLNCNTAGVETFTRVPCSWKNICATALANLALMRIRLMNPAWQKADYAAKHNDRLMPDLGWFSRKADIVPFLEVPRHWAAICNEKDKGETSTWASTLGNSIVSNPDTFRSSDETFRSANSGLALRNPNLFAFRSGYLTQTKSQAPRKRKAEEIGSSKHIATNDKADTAKINGPKPDSGNDDNTPKPDHNRGPKSDAVFIPPERASQRERPMIKTEDAPAFTANIPTIKKEITRPPSHITTKELVRERKPTAKKATQNKKSDQAPAKLIRRPPPYKPQDFNARSKAPGTMQVEGQFAQGPYYSFTDIPYNKRGFRYTMCEAVPSMPAIMYRQTEVEPHEARIDWSDMSAYMYLSKDGKSATTDKGFRMGRANVGVREGQWYWEVKVLRGNGDQGGHVRLGIARREASIDGPVGFDGYSYGIRDKGGEKLHLSRPKKFMDSFGTGDVIGFHLSLPKAPSTDISRDRIPIRYRQQLYFEQFEYNSSKDMEDLLHPSSTTKPATPAVLKGSYLKVYKNGLPMGTVFDNLYSFWPPNAQTQRDQPASDDGSLGYYPAVSVFHGGAVRLNFGPNFECPLQKDIFANGMVRPMSQRFDEQIAEDTVYDLLDEIDIGEDLNELSSGQQQLEVEPIREIAEYD